MKNPLRRPKSGDGTGVAAVDAMLDEGQERNSKPTRKERKAEQSRKEARLESVVDPVAPEAVTSDWSTQESLGRFRSPDGAWGLGLVADVWQEAIGGLSSRDSRNEAKGQLINAIKGDKIKVLTTADLMDQEYLGFIPDKRTLLGMEGFTMLREATYHWALVDLRHDDPEQLKIQVLPDIVKFSGVQAVAEGTIATDRLFAQAGNDSIDLFDDSTETVDGDDVVEYSAENIDEVNEMNADDLDENQFAETAEDDADLNVVPDDDDGTLGEAEVSEDVPDFDDMENASFDDVDGDQSAESVDDETANEVIDETIEDQDDQPFSGDDEIILDEDDEGDPVDDRVISSEDVSSEMTRRFRSDHLSLQVNLEAFFSVFPKGYQPVPFPTDLETSDWFNSQLRDMAQEFNTELTALHQEHMNALYRKFCHLSSGAITKVVDGLSLMKEDNPFGKLYIQGEKKRDEELDQIDAKVRREQQTIQDEFDQQKKAEGERARSAAESRYVRQYQPAMEEKQAKVEQGIRNNFHAVWDQKNRRILDMRADAAQQKHFEFESKIMRQLESEWSRLHEVESARREEYAERLVKMVEDHLQDDVARQKVLAEDMRQTDRVREAERQFNERMAEFKETHRAEDERLRAENERLRREFKQELDSRDAEYAKRLETSEEQLAFRDEANQKMRDELNALLERKDQEFSEREARHREALEVADRRHEADELALKRFEDQQGQSSRLNVVLMIVIAVVAVLVGGMVGAMVMSHQANATGAILPMISLDSWSLPLRN